ncbi:dcakd.2 family protein [Megaselia abdita]
MFLVAITGGIASGKTTVSNVFKENGITVIDADSIARQIVEPGKPAWKKIKEVFPEVIDGNGELNRDALGKLIFNDIEKRRILNQITHPEIHRRIFLDICKNFVCGTNYVILDLPLLFETGIFLGFIHKIICVNCDQEEQINRLIARNSLSFEDAEKRVKSQMPLEEKCEKSHFVIDNSGSTESTRIEAEKILEVLNDCRQHWWIRFYMFMVLTGFLSLLFWLDTLFKFLPFNAFRRH